MRGRIISYHWDSRRIRMVRDRPGLIIGESAMQLLSNSDFISQKKRAELDSRVFAQIDTGMRSGRRIIWTLAGSI